MTASLWKKKLDEVWEGSNMTPMTNTASLRQAGDFIAKMTGKENAGWVYKAADDIDALRRRVTALEMVIAEEIHPSDCQDEANAMIVDDILTRRRPQS